MNEEKNILDLFSVRKLNVVITGASKGIGLHLASFFANAGSNLLLVGRSRSVKKKKIVHWKMSKDLFKKLNKYGWS